MQKGSLKSSKKPFHGLPKRKRPEDFQSARAATRRCGRSMKLLRHIRCEFNRRRWFHEVFGLDFLSGRQFGFPLAPGPTDTHYGCPRETLNERFPPNLNLFENPARSEPHLDEVSLYCGSMAIQNPKNLVLLSAGRQKRSSKSIDRSSDPQMLVGLIHMLSRRWFSYPLIIAKKGS